MVMNHVIRSSISLASLASPEIRKDDDYTWSPEINRDDGSNSRPRGHYSLLEGPRGS